MHFSDVSDVWRILLQVHTRLVVTFFWIEKLFDKNVEMGFQGAVFHLCQQVLVLLLCNDRAIRAKENPAKHSL